jgi:ATP-dependent RNA helicase DDX35
MLSVPHVFLPDSLADEKSARRHYAVKEGDHLTLLNVHNAFEAARRAPQWSQARHVNHKAMRRACDLRKQLVNYITKLGIPLASCGRDSKALHRCLTSAFFANAAKLEPDGAYRTIRGGEKVGVHPFSVLHQHPTPWVVFNEMVVTTKPYLLGVSFTEPEWLTEVAPHFYTFKDTTEADLRPAAKSQRTR